MPRGSVRKSKILRQNECVGGCASCCLRLCEAIYGRGNPRSPLGKTGLPSRICSNPLRQRQRGERVDRHRAKALRDDASLADKAFNPCNLLWIQNESRRFFLDSGATRVLLLLRRWKVIYYETVESGVIARRL